MKPAASDESVQFGPPPYPSANSITPAQHCPPSCGPAELHTIAFFIIGAIQMFLFFYYGNSGYRLMGGINIPFTLFFSFMSIAAVLVKHETIESGFKELNRWRIYRHYYVLFMGTMLLWVASMSNYRFINMTIWLETNGSDITLRVDPWGCTHPHVDLQTAGSMNWNITNGHLYIASIPQYTAFRVILYCENSRVVQSKGDWLLDGSSVRYVGSVLNNPVAVPSNSQGNVSPVKLIVDSLPKNNPNYKISPMDILIG
ncbi:hypothetical protein HDV00_006360 [Rhizophlyctis rosea]|nr:hypothetical protein HDV00_006360 [Rhizophlyctis rosea]